MTVGEGSVGRAASRGGRPLGGKPETVWEELGHTLSSSHALHQPVPGRGAQQGCRQDRPFEPH